MTRMTSPSASASVNFTSSTDARIVTERSLRVNMFTAGGSCARSPGSSALTPSTTSTALEPGCLKTAMLIVGVPLGLSAS